MTGTAIAQAIPLAVSPFLTRLFTPEDFGLFALYFSISQLLSVFITGRYEYAIILPEKDEDAANVVALCILITILVSVLSMLILLPLKNIITGLLNNEEIGNYLWIMPLTIFSIGIYTTFNLWFNRKGKFKNISYGKVLRSTFTSFFSIGFGLTILRSAGLIIADTIGQIISAIYVFLWSLKFDSDKIISVSGTKMKEQARRFIHFPKFNILSGLLEKGSGQVPVILLTTFFGSPITGLFSLSQRVIAAPEALVAVSVGDVFRRQASIEYQQNGNCRKSFLKLFKLLLSVSIIPFIILAVTAPFLFAFIFGEEWRIAGNYAQIMTLMFFLSFVVSPLSNMFIVAEKQKIDLFIQIFLFAFVCISFIASRKIFDDPGAAILLYTITYSVKYCVEFFLSYKFSLGKHKNQ
jgi:O-antigen/teichoic acid export membrane protein